MKNDLAYLAGLMDGEGSWSIQAQWRTNRNGARFVNFGFRMTMTVKYGADEVMPLLLSTFGGSTYKYSGDECTRWALGKGADIKKATLRLIPFLRIKRKIAERFLEALAVVPSKRKDHLHGEPSWTLEMRAKVLAIASELNRKKPFDPDDRPSYLKVVKSAASPKTKKDYPYQSSTTGILGVSKHFWSGGKAFGYVAIACKGKQRLTKYFPGTAAGLKQAEVQAKSFREQLRSDV